MLQRAASILSRSTLNLCLRKHVPQLNNACRAEEAMPLAAALGAVPVLDLSAAESVVVPAARKACKETGFFCVINHGVEQDLITAVFEEQRKFFALHEEEKMKILQDENNRGYTPFKEETLDPGHQVMGDLKEGLYYGREVEPGSAEAQQPLQGPNQWPSEALLPDYRKVTTQYYDAVCALGFRLLKLLALALDLPADYFVPKFQPPTALLRPLHYAAQRSKPEEGIFGAGAHTDYGMVTILATDGVPGLQICLDGVWQDVAHPPGGFIINLGDMLERWTNGKFRSTLHRVVNTTGSERYSIAFFFEPNFYTVVECLPSCCVDCPPKYPPTTAGQHLLDKYAATHAGYHQEEGGETVATAT